MKKLLSWASAPALALACATQTGPSARAAAYPTNTVAPPPTHRLQISRSAAAALAASTNASAIETAGTPGVWIPSRLSGQPAWPSQLVTSALLNINFGFGTEKVGPAAVGSGPNDVWNWCNTLWQDPFYMADLVWSDGTDSGATLEVDNGPGLWGNSVGDPMYDSYLYPWDGGDVSIWLGNMPAGTYDVFIYGHAASDDGNSVFELWVNDLSYGQKGTSAWGPGWNSTNWEEGQQYVLCRNVTIAEGDTVLLDVQPDVLGVALVNGMQLVPSAAISRDPPQSYRLIDLKLGGGSQKSGYAAVGLSTNDFWNWYDGTFYGLASGALTGLLRSDGTPTGAGLVVTNAPGYWGAVTGDPMYDDFIYPLDWGHIGLVLTNLPGDGLTCDLYLYGHAQAADYNSLFSLSTGGVTYGPRGTTIWGTAWNSPAWEEGIQYVVFRNVPLVTNQSVFIDIAPGLSGYAQINGLQIAIPWDRDGNGLPDWWEMKYFGQTGIDANGDYDNDGVSNLDEYQNGTDPNKIRFRVMTDARFTNNPEVPIQVELFGGVPSQMAVLTNMDFASAVWQPFSANFTLSLGPADGRYDIWVGLRALAQGSPTNWDSIAVNLDRVPPMMCLTSPLPNTTLSMPYIQVKGYTQKPIQHLEYDVTNSAGLNTFTGAFVAEQYYDTNCFCFTTNFFELVDVDLTNGPNTIFIRATDIAGNSATNSFSFTLDLAGDTVPPAVSIYWPQDGDILSGTNFTLRGLVDDPTAKLTVQVTNSSGSSNVLVALVERNGLFWAQDLPLGEGTNYLLVTATDAAGNLTTSNLTVLQSSVGLIIDDIPRERLWDWTITVTGAIESDGYTVWVNGVMATNNGDGTWVASEVPLNEGNTAVIQARAISNNDNGGNGTGGGTGARPTYQDSRNPSSPTAIQNEGGKGRQVRIYIEHHHQEWTYNRHTHYDFYVNDNGEPGERFDWVDLDWQEKAGHDWTDGKGGNGWWSRVQVDRSQGAEPATNDCHSTITWPPTLYPVVVPGVWTTNLGCIEPRFPELVPCISAEHCDINNNYDSENPPMLILDPWHPYYMQFVAATIHSDASRQADATVKVFTGDKDEKHPSRKSVLELFVPVAQITNGSLSCGGVGELPVPAAQVNVGEIGRPNADYTVYKVAERGKTLDATVTAPPKRFIWAVSGDMHDLAIQCVCDVPKERERTTVGVGEYVNMTFQPDFWLHPPLWGHTGGGLNVGPTIPANAVLYTASSNATSDSVMANFPAPGGKHVTLTTTFGVVAPDGVTTTVREFDWAGSLPLVGAGMKLDVVLQPTTVSFSRVEVMEPGEPTTGITGYFSNHPPPTHAGNGADVWHPVNCGNLIMGPPIDAFDHANSYGWPVGQWGTYTWPIHPIWRVPGTGTTHTLSGWTDQVHTLQVDGTVIVQKFGHTVTRGPNEPRGSGQ